MKSDPRARPDAKHPVVRPPAEAAMVRVIVSGEPGLDVCRACFGTVSQHRWFSGCLASGEG
jgi:hypothetical protein